jgi:hypothetical protein
MKKYLLLITVLFMLAGCSMNGSYPPEKPKWKYIRSTSGKCYEYINWFSGYTGYTIAGQVDPSYCQNNVYINN